MQAFKINKKVIFSFFIIALICFSFVSVELDVFARSYDIYEYTINLTVNADGSADVEEIVSYDFNGEFNGVFRDVDFSDTGGIRDYRVFNKEGDGTLTEMVLVPDGSGTKGLSGIYEYSQWEDTARFTVYYQSNNQERVFVYKYSINDIITKYNDIAEFNRKIVDSNWDVTLNNVTINIRLPYGATEEDIRVFGHGSLLGKSQILDGQNVVFTVPYVDPGEVVETLVMFPTKLVPSAKRIVNEDFLSQRLANEKRLAEEANEIRENALRQYEREIFLAGVGTFLVVILIIIWLITIIMVYKKYDKELKPNFKGKYYRELPGDYTPAEMGVLLTMGSVNTNDLTATLMDLVRKRYLVLSEEKITKRGFWGREKEEVEYFVTLNSHIDDENLKKHEKFLIKWFIDKLGNGSSIGLSSISEYTNSESRARKFISDFDLFKKLAIQEANKLDFFDKASKKGSTIMGRVAVSYLVLAIVILIFLNTHLAFVLFPIAIISFFYWASVKRRTPYGNEQKAKWDAFKNFLKDFSRMDKATLPSIVIWEHYLVYAISLGVAKEVIKQLPLIINEYDFNNDNLTYMGSYGGYVGFSAFSHTLNSTISSVNHAISRANSVAHSTLSSSSGGGGGFSGGSSGGGGGGGGGGAF